MNANDKNGLGYSTQLNELSSNHETDSENSLSIFDGRSSDDEHIPENDRFSKNGYKAVPPPITGNFLTPRADISFAGLDEYAIRNKIIKSQTTKLNTKVRLQINRDSVIIEDWTSDDEEEVSGVQKVRPENQTVKTRDDKSGQNSHKQGVGFRKVKACFVCRSTEHLIKDCNFHDKKSQESNLKNMVNTGKWESKPVWDNTKRVNHPNFSKYPHLSETFVPAGVSSRTGLHRPTINTARSVCTARPSINTARPVSTVRPSISTARPSISTVRPVYASRSIYPRMDNVRPRGSCSPIKSPVVNTGKGKLDTDLKESRWVWRPKGNYLDHVSKDSGSFMLKKGNPEILLQDHTAMDSGCSSHMTGNKAYLSDYEDFNGGFVAFGKVVLQILHIYVHMANLKYSDKHNMVAFLKKPNESVGFAEVVDFLKVRTLANRTQQLIASIDSKEYTITEAYVRSKLQLADAIGIHNLSDAELYAGLATLGYVIEGSAQLAEPHHTPVDPISSTSQPPIPSPPHPSPPHPSLPPYSSPPHPSPPPHSPPFSPPHYLPSRSYEAPLSEGNTSGSAKDSMHLKELIDIVPRLVTRINTLETELQQTKTTYGKAVLTLVKRVKILEKALKRKTQKVVISKLEGEEPEDQGRIIQDIDDDPLVSLVRESMKMKEKSTDFVTPTKASEEAQEEDIRPTILEAAKTLSKVASQGVSKVKSTDKGKRYKRRASTGTAKVDFSYCYVKGVQGNGKALMVQEDIKATHKTKEQIRQEKLEL
ncbi:hypothetical protein Tco_0238029 [Tanacetum coccineum]